MMPILARRCFGNLDYATIYSRISVVASISNVVGAFFWGTLIDFTGSYVPMFAGVIMLLAASIVLVVAIVRKSDSRVTKS